MKDLTIFFTLWNRSEERFAYFQETIKSLQNNLIIDHHSYQFVASIESEGHILKTETENFCNQNHILYYYKPGKPNLGSNMNYGLSKCDSDFVLYMQDDWILKEKLNLDNDIDFLKANNNIYVLRYFYSHIRTFDNYIDEKLKIKLLNPDSGTYYYGDNPHLKKKTYHEMTGPYYSKGNSAECENSMVGEAKRLSKQCLIAAKDHNLFQHIGEKSSMWEKQ